MPRFYVLILTNKPDFGKRADGWRRVKNRTHFHALKVPSIRFSADSRPIPKSLYRAGFWLHLLPVQKVENKKGPQSGPKGNAWCPLRPRGKTVRPDGLGGLGPAREPDGTALLGPMVWPSRAGEPEHWEQRLPLGAAVPPDWRPPASENCDPFGE